MNHFCTITTYDHLYKVLALSDSIKATQSDFALHILCIDKINTPKSYPHCSFYEIGDLSGIPVCAQIVSKYKSEADKLRWSLKSVFLSFLLNEKADKVIYVDNDIYFFGDASFLFEQLDEHSFLLTPHHYPRDPKKDQNWLEANYKVGLYNAGFVAVNANAKEPLNWWAECCAYRCEKNPLRGTFDDQKYLDLIPILAEDTLVLKHKGCNVAEWNRKIIKRSQKQDGSVWLDKIYPLIFIHFNHSTIRAIDQGQEPYLIQSLNTYMASLKIYKEDVQLKMLIKTESTVEKIKYYIWRKATDFNL